jgi:hypothetical protein
MMTESEYHQEIRDLAAEAVREARSGEHGTGEQCREWLLEWVHETLDGHEFVIYTAKAQAVLAISNNDGAYVESYGAEGALDRDGHVAWESMAYAAMEADLMDYLSRMDGFDVNDPNPEPEDEDDTPEVNA